MGIFNRGNSLREIQIYGEKVGRPKKRRGAGLTAGILLGLILVAAAGWFGYSIYGQMKEQKQQIASLQEQLREVQTEKVLLDQALKEKNQLLEDIRSGNVSSGNVKEYRAYLTFDDGPSENALRVMDILDKYGIKGTFFMNGAESELAARVYKRAIEDGHILANHTYSHNYGELYQSWDNFYAEVQKMEDCVKSQTGYSLAKIIRFPGGSNNGKAEVMNEIKRNLTRLGYTYFDWNVSGEDAIKSNITAEEIVQNVIKYTDGKATALILLHTTSKTDATVEALPAIIEYLQKEGYTFHTLQEADAPTGIVFNQ